MGALTGLSQANLTKICSYVDLDQRALLDVTGEDPNFTLVYDDSIQSQITEGQNASAVRPDPVALTRTAYSQSVPTNSIWTTVAGLSYTAPVTGLYFLQLAATHASNNQGCGARILVNGSPEASETASDFNGATQSSAQSNSIVLLAKGDVVTWQVLTKNNSATVTGVAITAALMGAF